MPIRNTLIINNLLWDGCEKIQINSAKDLKFYQKGYEIAMRAFLLATATRCGKSMARVRFVVQYNLESWQMSSARTEYFECLERVLIFPFSLYVV